MPKLESDLYILRQQGKKIAESGIIAPEVWWQLKQQRTPASPERAGHIEKACNVFVYVGKSALMRDPPRRFDGETERRRYLRGPRFHYRRCRHAIEGVVDLDCRKALCVIAQHLLGGQALGVELSFPGRVAESAGSDRQLHLGFAQRRLR